MKEPTIVELLNQIELMKQALLFYGNKDNYTNGRYDGAGDFITPVDSDSGHQARFTLNQLELIDNYSDELTKIIADGVNIDDISEIDKETMNKMNKINEINKILNKNK